MKYIIISGIDGSGKTTIINGVANVLKRKNINFEYHWLRYNHLIAKLLHGFARLIGLSKRYKSQGKIKYRHEFYRSYIFSKVYIIATFVDTLIGKVFLSIGRKNVEYILCDRWVNDIIIDLGVKTGNKDIFKSRWYKIYLNLLPKVNSYQFVIYRNINDIKNCRTENQEDPDFDQRNYLYNELGRLSNVNKIFNHVVSDCVDKILEMSNNNK